MISFRSYPIVHTSVLHDHVRAEAVHQLGPPSPTSDPRHRPVRLGGGALYCLPPYNYTAYLFICLLVETFYGIELIDF
jgi:hypothetical protein